MNLESPKVTVAKSAKDIFDSLSDVKNFEKLMPENIRVYYNLSLLYDKNEDNLNAEKTLLNGLKIDVNNESLLYALAFQYSKLNQIEKDHNIVNNIIKVRDSMGKRYIHGSLGKTWMITEKAYSPYFLQTKINHKLAFETKGTWQLKNDFMAGPFINYAIKDTKNNRYLILDGFTYNPSKSKRDLVFELEAMMKSVVFLP